MPLVRCLGCQEDYELADLSENTPQCPSCGERHPYDATPVNPDGGSTIVLGRWMAVVVALAVVGVLITFLLPERGLKFTGDGQEGLPAGPFVAEAPWVLRWECENPPVVVFLDQYVEGQEDPEVLLPFGKREAIPRVAERRIDFSGRFRVRLHPAYRGKWKVVVLD